MWNLLLFPIGMLFWIAVVIRNLFYDKKLFKSTHFEEVRTFCVGNLSVGGTGKTPHVEYLIRKYSDRLNTSVLSRGYGRKTKGFLEATDNSTAQDIGDEPAQMYAKFKEKVKVFVGEKRVNAVEKILDENKRMELIIMDDAFQHRAIRADKYILITSYYPKIFANDLIMPVGRLRESRKGAKRADVVIISKCPEDISIEERERIQTRISHYTFAPVFFTKINYLSPVALPKAKEVKNPTKVILVTGIAQTQPMLDFLNGKYELVKHFKYTDHYNFTKNDVQEIQKYWNQKGDDSTIILSTEKDMVKLINPAYTSIVEQAPFYYLPIEVDFLENEEGFLKLLENTL